MQNFNAEEASKNFILNSLLPTEFEWLQPRLEKVELRQGEMIYQLKGQIRSVYFPITCLLSWTNSTDLGETVEVGITGWEGMAGIPLLLGEDISPWQIEVQLPGTALRLSAQDFTHVLERSAALRKRAAAFVYLKMVQLSQSALCNRFHRVEERLCRWLLAAQDHTQSPKLGLTREILAEMIGAGRPAVSITTGLLQSAGLICSSRGEITILNREGMEDAACDCYQIVKEALNRYLAKEA